MKEYGETESIRASRCDAARQDGAAHRLPGTGRARPLAHRRDRARVSEDAQGSCFSLRPAAFPGTLPSLLCAPLAGAKLGSWPRTNVRTRIVSREPAAAAANNPEAADVAARAARAAGEIRRQTKAEKLAAREARAGRSKLLRIRLPVLVFALGRRRQTTNDKTFVE
jgi:hypothetical protein